MNEGSVADRKRELRAKRKADQKVANAAYSVRVKREFKCFWTWPWGHVYKWSNSAQKSLCVGCDKKRTT
jgi:hypothetical protein